MTPVPNQDKLLATAQCILTYLGDASNSTPNSMLEGIVSGKSLLRAIVSGALVVCEPGPKIESADLADSRKTAAPATED